MAQIKITNTSQGKSNILIDETTNIFIENNSYYFKIQNYSQEIHIQKNQVKIIRPEMTINLQLNKTIESIYKDKDNELKMKFLLHKLVNNKKQLEFNYSLVDNLKKDINNIDVKIKL